MLSDAIDEYIDQRVRQEKKHGTLEADRSILSRFLLSVGNIQTRHVTGEHVEKFFLGKDNAMGLTHTINEPSSYNKARDRTIGFLNWACDKKYVRSYGITPGSNGEGRSGDLFYFVPRKKLVTKDKLFLTDVQMVKCLEVARERHERDYMLVSLAIGTGLRGVDLVAMRWGQLDLDEGWLYTGIEKTNDRDRKPLTEELLADLRAWLIYYENEQGPIDPEWFVVPAKNPIAQERDEHGGFTCLASKALLRPTSGMKTAHRVVKEILVGAGVHQPGNALHAFRRSAADLYYTQVKLDGHGEDALVETASFLNHKDTKTTAIYLNKNRVREARDARLRGKKFLTRDLPVVTDGVVVPIRKAEQG